MADTRLLRLLESETEDRFGIMDEANESRNENEYGKRQASDAVNREIDMREYEGEEGYDSGKGVKETVASEGSEDAGLDAFVDFLEIYEES